jgi:hypothetical protein
MTQQEINQEALDIVGTARSSGAHGGDCNSTENVIALVSTACKDDYVAFGEWLDKNTYEQKWKCEGRFLNKDAKLHTITELYDIFHKENGRK